MEKQSRHILIKSQINRTTQNLAAEMFSVGIKHKAETDGGDTARTGLFYLVNKEANSNTLINRPQDFWGIKGPYFLLSLFIQPLLPVLAKQVTGSAQISSCPGNRQHHVFCFQSLRTEKCGSLILFFRPTSEGELILMWVKK